MSESKIMACTCTHSFQDFRYGAGKRIMNKTASDTPTWRCTVCAIDHRKEIPKKKKAK